MKRILSISVLLLVVFAATGFAEPYDSEVVVGVMRNNIQHIRSLGSLIEDGDYYATARAFFSLADGMMNVLPMDPPKGAEDDWHETISMVIDTALAGVGACGERDDEAMLAAQQKLFELMQHGHSTFR